MPVSDTSKLFWWWMRFNLTPKYQDITQNEVTDHDQGSGRLQMFITPPEHGHSSNARFCSPSFRIIIVNPEILAIPPNEHVGSNRVGEMFQAELLVLRVRARDATCGLWRKYGASHIYKTTTRVFDGRE